MMRAPAWATGERGRLARASTVGAVLALLLFAWLGSRGTLDVLEHQRSGDFYDAQANAWLDGTWQVSGDVLSIERFLRDGGSYMYQGPWPALLRLPVVAVTARFDGRLTLVSMLLGVAVATAATARLHWRVRTLVRGDTPLARGDLWLAGLATFVVGGGSAMLYEASRPWVYHEAAVWGAAWSIAAIDATVGCVTRPTRRRFLWAALTTTLALTSRFSVGLAGVAALAIVAGANLLVRRGWLRPLHTLGSAPAPSGQVPVLAPGLAATVPLAVYAAINWIKFRSLFSIPFWSQGFTLENPVRQRFLEENDGTLFGLKFVPSTVVHYVRPDAFSLSRAFPFVDFPAKATAIGGVEFDLIDDSTSIPVSMPVLTVLAVVGVVALFRRAGGEVGTGIGALRGPTLGALAGALTILPFGYIANRYLVDALPMLVIAALVGAQVLLGRRPRTRGGRRLPWVGLAVLVAVGLWVNLSHALIFQRLYAPNTKDDVIAAFVDTRYDVGQSAGLDPSIPVAVVQELPSSAPRGDLAIVGDCDGLYLSDGLPTNPVKPTVWNAVERTEAGGRRLFTVDFPVQPPGTRLPLLSMHSDDGDGQLHAEWRGGAGVWFDYLGPGSSFPSRTWFLPPGRTYTLDVVVDPQLDFLQVFLDDRLYYESRYYGSDDATIDIGVDTLDDPLLEDRYAGVLEPLPERTGVCQELRREALGR